MLNKRKKKWSRTNKVSHSIGPVSNMHGENERHTGAQPHRNSWENQVEEVDEEEIQGFSPKRQMELDEDEEVEGDEACVPLEPDLDWYLSFYDLDDGAKVAVCRTYASYLVAKGRTGVTRPGPPSNLAKKQRSHGSRFDSD